MDASPLLSLWVYYQMVADKGINDPHGQLFVVDPKVEDVWHPAISSKANNFDHAQHGSDDLNITYTKIRIVGNDQTDLFVQVYRDDEIINFLRGKYLLPPSHLKPCGEQGGEMKAGWAADELGEAGDEVKGGYDLEDREIVEVSLLTILFLLSFSCVWLYTFTFDFAILCSFSLFSSMNTMLSSDDGQICQ